MVNRQISCPYREPNHESTHSMKSQIELAACSVTVQSHGSGVQCHCTVTRFWCAVSLYSNTVLVCNVTVQSHGSGVQCHRPVTRFWCAVSPSSHTVLVCNVTVQSHGSGVQCHCTVTRFWCHVRPSVRNLPLTK